jgi:hypothetical protein
MRGVWYVSWRLHKISKICPRGRQVNILRFQSIRCWLKMLSCMYELESTTTKSQSHSVLERLLLKGQSGPWVHV